MATEASLTQPEQEVVDLLAQAWNKFMELEQLHPDERDEMRKAIHDAQHMIMCRPVRRHWARTQKLD